MASLSAAGVLVTELVYGDGPHTDVANDFLHQTCVRCRQELQGSPYVIERGYHCRDCLIGIWPRRKRG